MLQIRQMTFETNSSSTHSIVICTKKQFEDWKMGKCFFNANTEKFVNPDADQIEEYRKEAIEQYKIRKDSDPYSVSWDMLPSEYQEKYIDAHVKLRLEQERASCYCMSYDNYKYHYQDGCEYTEKYFTTEHGDEVVAFGKGGYD